MNTNKSSILPGNTNITSNRKWIKSRIELWLIASLCIVGMLSAVYTFPLLDHYPYNAGRNVIGLFVPPFLSALYLVAISCRQQPDKILLFKTFLLYVVLVLPFTPLMLQVFQPNFGDDFHRYFTYARYMIDHHTLYGADNLAFPGMGKYYLTQPGYRYFIAGELLLFKDLYRFVQFINLALLLLGIFLFIQVIKKRAGAHAPMVLLIILLLSPYAIKNTIMGLSEWFTAFLVMLATWLYVMKRSPAVAIFVLGLVPFFRQNHLIAILMIAVVIILFNRNRLILLACFLFPLFLPLYHNLYFAGEWRFLVKLHPIPLLNSTHPGLNLSVMGENLFRLIGLEIMPGKIRFEWMAFAFLPFSIFVIIQLTRNLSSGWRLYYIMFALAALLPGLFLGKDYYPRFEFMSIVVILAGYQFIPLQNIMVKPSFLVEDPS